MMKGEGGEGALIPPKRYRTVQPYRLTALPQVLRGGQLKEEPKKRLDGALNQVVCLLI